MWLDEALTVNIAKAPLHLIPHLLRADGAPPLYYLLLHFWMKVFGTSDLGARSLSGRSAFSLCRQRGRRVTRSVLSPGGRL